MQIFKSSDLDGDDDMVRARVPLGKFIKEYSVRNKANEDISVYSVTNSQG